MSKRARSEPASDRILCPDCPADFPTPFSSRYIHCRRCGTEFVAPDDARTPRATDDEEWDDPDTDETDAKPALSAMGECFPTIALCFNLATALLWSVGYVSFESTVVTIALITSALVVENR